MRLIDAEELEIDGWYLCRTVQLDKNTMEYQTKKPTAFKVLEVVRCKDCKYKKEHRGGDICYRLKGTAWIADDDFCSYAERRSG